MMKNKLLLILSFVSNCPFANSGNVDSEKKGQVKNWINAMPVKFIENKGQMTDMAGNPVPSVLFQADGPGINTFITEKGITYLFLKKEEKSKNELGKKGFSDEKM